jgi:hypothetical protein
MAIASPPPPPAPAGASTSDVLTAIKNIVLALSTAANNYLNVQGQTNFTGLTAPTVVKSTGGRIAQISVIVAGSGTGRVYDSNSLNTTTKPLFVIPTTAGIYIVNMPANFGLLIVPGAGGQTVSGSYS